jgi:hypothetical protein
MLFEGLVQARTDCSLLDGEWGMLRLGQSLEVFTSDAHPRYWDMNRRGNLYTCGGASDTGTMSVASTNVIGLILTNPPNSPVLVSLVQIIVASKGSPGNAVTLGLYGASGGTVTHTTPIAVNSLIQGSLAQGWALADHHAQLPNNSTFGVIRALGGTPVASGAVQGNYLTDDVAGAIILEPGSVVALQQVQGAGAYSPRALFVWEEIPL